MAPTCHYCGEHAPYSCDAPGEAAGALCGRPCCAEHSVPMFEGAKDIGKSTLCDEHAHLQRPKPGTRKGQKSAQGKKKQEKWWDDPVVDPTIEYETLTIDEEDFLLAWSFRAIAQSEALVNRGLPPAAEKCNLMQGIAAFLLDMANATQYVGLLRAALVLAYPEVTLEQAAALIRLDTMPDIRLALITAYNLSMPEKKRMQVEVKVAEDEASA